MNISTNVSSLAPSELAVRPHAATLSIGELLPLLASPDSGHVLTLSGDGRALTDGVHHYPFRDSLPLLIPQRLQPYFSQRVKIPFDTYADPLLQYFLLATIKQSGEINAAPADVHVQRHLWRMAEFVGGCRGTLVDVGCDDANLGASLFSPLVHYVGLDPFCVRSSPFRLVGLGEFLPFRGGSVDNVVFNTSLDHIMDWRRAIGEARRVLKPGGRLTIATLIWTDNADLLADTVHFHHFRDYEIYGALASDFTIASEQRYTYKNNEHRHGMYIQATRCVA